ncbi:hypothetical protein EVAR_6212_1 [Eumeta japonica]|uniref:Uncharacterized protein n=1 Tax=Eumeta variegata TaxID=151549 RepID=A0A4C1Z2U6_EUMVA|nr:hypothetical protein EVAR_6212_1 [Eumeta japonica]
MGLLDGEIPYSHRIQTDSSSFFRCISFNELVSVTVATPLHYHFLHRPLPLPSARFFLHQIIPRAPHWYLLALVSNFDRIFSGIGIRNSIRIIIENGFYIGLKLKDVFYVHAGETVGEKLDRRAQAREDRAVCLHLLVVSAPPLPREALLH